MVGLGKFLFLLICVLNLAECLRFVSHEYQKPALQVETQNGAVQGTRLSSRESSNGYYFAYLGIPYAKPPVGPLRFKAPQWADKWNGVLDASKEGPGCVEIFMRLRSPMDIVGQEDCLYLNVFTRYNPNKMKKLQPVMVFFYGGAFLEGNPDATNYGPDLLVSKDVVVVHFNYRTGIFGFLNTQDLASPGNYGLKDQNMVLRWVQKNIRNFGGDPSSVTIFGQSAGSVSVHYQILSPKSRGLFHKAILESGTVLCHWGSQHRPKNVAYLLGVANGITHPNSSYDLIESLRRVKFKDLRLTIIGVTLATIAQSTLFGLPFSPSIEPDHDEAFISQDHWYEMLDKGNFNRVPTIIGVNSNESLFFEPVLRAIKPLLFTYDVDPSFATPPAMNISNIAKAMHVGKIVTNYYLGPKGKFASAAINTLVRFTTHDYFTRPIKKTAMLMAKHTPLYFYYFSYDGTLGANGIHPEGQHPQTKGVAHVEELYYLFNKFNNPTKKDTDFLVRKRMLAMWTNFARYGNPTPTRTDLLDNVVWPQVTPRQYRMKYLEINDTLTVRDSFNEQVALDWWEGMFQTYAEPPLRTY